ncbi:hypothetical protein AAF712_004498 [Marasmius tenuissimus]|uniref:F-box domain-containing protein n=1 Tax=Marasmius tenuissimus TaxID=585030 RepID=A0ABR3A4J5_9AGAR
MSVNTLQAYDAKIQTLSDELKRVQYDRNLLVPICRLPAEILGSIFTFYADLHTHPIHSRDLRGHHLLHIVLVCSLWKTTAYNTPSMWASPDFTSPKLARTMLTHAKSTPLNITWDDSSYGMTSGGRDEPFQEALLAKDSRIASLNLISYSPRTSTLFEGTLSKMTQSAPHMKSICINCAPGGSMIDLPEGFLAGDAPQLRRFELAGCGMTWEPSLLRNLTFLSVEHQRLESRAELRIIFEALQEAPLLQELALEHCALPSATLPPDTTLAFPRLNRLYLALDIEPCCALLRQMTFPDTTRIHLRCDTPLSIPDPSYDHLFTYISQLLAPAALSSDHPRVIKGLVLNTLEFSHTLSLSIQAWNTHNIASDPNTGNSLVEPHFWLEVDTEEEQMVAKMLRLLELGPLVRLEALRVDTFYSLSQEAIIQCLGNSDRLNYVSLEDQVPYEFIKLLSRNLTAAPRTTKRKKRKGKAAGRASQPQPEEDPPEALPPLFPTLKTLSLARVDFRKESNHLLRPLIQGLKLRSENGCPLEKVVLTDCTRLTAGDVKRIERQVDVVEWDGCELEEDEIYDEYLPPFGMPFGLFGGYGLGGYIGPHL